MRGCLQWTCFTLFGIWLILSAGAKSPLVTTAIAQTGAESSASWTVEEQLFAEELKHAQRMARLVTIHQLASEDDYTEVISQIDQLIEREYKRHNDAVEQLKTLLMQSGSGDVNSVWWKDIGKKKDPNVSGRLRIGGYEMMKIHSK